ncbi:MAG: beta-galactosidase trimerization domain-containing protein [Candidatus Hydrogenedentota bacterium]
MIRMLTTWCLLGMTALHAGCVSLAHAPAETGPHAVSHADETRHVAWANPLPEGPIPLLLVAPQHTLRDGVELAQRLDVQLDVVALWDRTHLGYDPGLPAQHVPGMAREEVLDALDSALAREPAVIILANFDLAVLPAATLSSIFRAVTHGAGLVLVNHDPAPGVVYDTFLDALAPADPPPHLAAGIGARATPAWATRTELAHAAGYGEGRVVRLAVGDDRPATHCLIPALRNPLAALPEYFDTYLALVCRAVRWAAGREPALHVEAVHDLAPEGPPEEEIPPNLPEEYVETMGDQVLQDPIRRYRVELNAPPERNYNVVVQVRDPNRNLQTRYRDLARWKEGEKTYPVEILAGPGEYLLDIWLTTRKGGVVLWHTEPIAVGGWPTFTDLRLAKDHLLPNDALDMTAEVRAHYGATQPFFLYARGIDTFSRVVAEAYQKAPPDGGRVSMVLPFADLIDRRVKLEVFAVPGEPHLPQPYELNMAACAVRLLPVRQPRVDRMNGAIAVAHAAYEYNARHYLENLRGFGVDAAYTADGEAAHRFLSGQNLRPIAELSNTAVERATPALARDPCLSDPDHRAEVRKHIAEYVPYFARGGVLDFSLGNPAYLCASDENVCQSQACMAGFHADLARRYGDVAALNAAWETAYADWDAVAPLHRDEARQRGLYAPWVAFRRYMDGVFAEYVRFAVDTVAAVDRYAHVGLRATTDGDPLNGYDLHALARNVPLLAVAPLSPAPALVRDYQPPGVETGITLDTGDPALVHWQLWRQALHRMPFTWLTTPYGTAHEPVADPLLDPGGTAQPLLVALGETLTALREGAGPLLLAAERSPAHVALVYSRASHHLHAALPDFARTSYPDTVSGAMRLLDRLGTAYRFVPAETLTADALAPYAAVILPMTAALGKPAAEALAAYAEDGGTLVADILPATFTADGARRDASPLAEVFGVVCDHTDAAPHAASGAVRVPVEDATETGGSQPPAASMAVEAAVRDVLADPRVGPDTATPLGTAGETSLALARLQEGDEQNTAPHTLLLNHPFPAPASAGDSANEAAVRALVRSFLAPADVTATVPVESAAFHGVRERFSYGAAQLDVLLRDPRGGPESEAVRLRYPREKGVYNVVSGAPARTTRTVRDKLGRGEGRLFAVLPYEVAAVTVTAPEAMAQGQRLPVAVQVEADDGEADKHLVRVDLFMAMGKHLEYYRRFVTCEDGRGKTFLPLAFDELTGHYTITATDVLSGVSGRTTVRVLPHGG